MKIILKSILILVIFLGGNFAHANNGACINSEDNNLDPRSKWQLLEEIADLNEKLDLAKESEKAADELLNTYRKKYFIPKKQRVPDFKQPPTYCSQKGVQYQFDPIFMFKSLNIKGSLTCYWHTKLNTSYWIEAFHKFAVPLGHNYDMYAITDEFLYNKWCTHTWHWDGYAWSNKGTKCESVGPRLY